MENTNKLLAGQRFLLQDDSSFIRLRSGTVEVYAVTRAGDELSFRQCYLLTLTAGEAVFPAMDEFEELNIQLYATEDAELCSCSFAQIPADEQRLLMEHWFQRLVEIPWLQQKADRGDDMLQVWRQQGFLGRFVNREALLEEFRENQQILSMFLGMQFGAEDKRLSRRIRIRKMAKKMLVENGIRSLLGEEKLYGGEREGAAASPSVMDAVFVVGQVAKALSMPADNLGIAEEKARDLETVGDRKSVV